jgi:hypothetical protein
MRVLSTKVISSFLEVRHMIRAITHRPSICSYTTFGRVACEHMHTHLDPETCAATPSPSLSRYAAPARSGSGCPACPAPLRGGPASSPGTPQTFVPWWSGSSAVQNVAPAGSCEFRPGRAGLATAAGLTAGVDMRGMAAQAGRISFSRTFPLHWPLGGIESRAPHGEAGAIQGGGQGGGREAPGRVRWPAP